MNARLTGLVRISFQKCALERILTPLPIPRSAKSGWKGLSASLLAGLFALVLPVGAWSQSTPDGDDFRVTLLGTGSPQPTINRFGSGVLVQAGGQTLLIDCGRGITMRLIQAGIKLGSVNRLFITHLHSDHVSGIPDLWLTGWLEIPSAQRKGAFQVFGPAGTKNMMEHLERAFEWDIGTRIADQKLAKENVEISVTEIKEGAVLDSNGVKVTAFEVDHGDLVRPAYGYRIDYGGRSVVVSGDTRFNENLIQHATGTDLLIHQVAAVRSQLLASPVFQAILAHHTKPEEAGIVFARTKPRLAVFYHFSLLGTAQVPPMTEQEVVDLTRKTYGGPLLVGEDLMVFRIGQAAVHVAR
jgi:ribonuclease Z